MTSVALTIAGSDPSGGAGLQADLKTFHQHGVFGASVVTLLTVQNTRRVLAVELLTDDFVIAQLDAVLEDIPPNATKIGALGNVEIIEAIAQRVSAIPQPLVIDPVMISKHGDALLSGPAVRALPDLLFPHAFLVTPNAHEARALTGIAVVDRATMTSAARAIADLGPKNVLIKGGSGERDAVDLLWSEGKPHWLIAERLETRHRHGSGCAYSAAITARLARGEPILDAVRAAKNWITHAIREHPGLGHGFGPINLFASEAVL